MKKKNLQIAAEISSSPITKMSKNRNVNTETLAKVCKVLDCDISDIIEMIKDSCY